MFTGIVEEIGVIQSIIEKGNTLFLSIEAKKITEDLKLGDSVAVNGVCLTVTNYSSNFFQVDVMPETFKSTSLSSLQRGSKVNLERAMAANGRFGGHFVSGHVDCVGKIEKRTPKENAIYIDISFPKEIASWMLPKGSICLDGTSLTIFQISGSILTVSIIPHTAKQSVIGMKQVGDVVNIECDQFIKYLHSYISNHFEKTSAHQGISADFLKEHGFM